MIGALHDMAVVAREGWPWILMLVVIGLGARYT